MAGNVLNKGNGAGEGTPELTLESIMAEVNKQFDAKLSAKLDDFKKTGLGDAIKAQLGPVNEQLGTINEALGKLVASSGQGDKGQGQGQGDGKGQIPPEVNVKIKNMEEKLQTAEKAITTLTSAKEEAEKKAEETDRHSVIRSALQGLRFVNEKAGETAFSIVAPHVRRLDDSSLVAGINGDCFPVDAFVKDYLQKEHAYLFQSSGSSGSGAQSNSGSSVRMGAKADIGMIKVGMKPEDRAAVVSSIAAALATQE